MFAITGATGQFGRLAISALLDQHPADEVIALARDPLRADEIKKLGVEVRRFDYDDLSCADDALRDVNRLLLISSDALNRRVEQHRNVIAAAIAANVDFIAYTSVLHADINPLIVAPSHRETEAMLRDSGVRYAALRNGWYIENYLLGVEAAIESGVLLGSSGEGRISGAARADYAQAAATVLSAGAAAAGIHELAGDTSFTLSDVADAIAQVTGVSVVYQDLPEQEYALALEKGGLPPAVSMTLAGLSSGAAGGILADDSRSLSGLIGRRTASLREVVAVALGIPLIVLSGRRPHNMLTFYYCPYACSMASHVALEEAGAAFTATKINIFTGEQFRPDYKAINPRAKVPALRFDDGRVLLESTAILGWIGNSFPEASLLGDDPLDQARTIATCAWLSGTVHPTFKQFIHPDHITDVKGDHAAIKARAKATYWSHLLEIDAILADSPWMMGDRFTVADAYALVFFPWGRELDLPIHDLVNLSAMKNRLIERPAARRALEREKSALLRI